MGQGRHSDAGGKAVGKGLIQGHLLWETGVTAKDRLLGKRNRRRWRLAFSTSWCHLSDTLPQAEVILKEA